MHIPGPKTKSSFCLQSSLYSSLLVSSPPRSGRCCSSVFWVMWVIWIILHLSLKIFWEKSAGWRPQTSNKGRPRNNSPGDPGEDPPRWNWKMLLGKRTSGRNTCLVSCQQAQTLKAEGKKRRMEGFHDTWVIPGTVTDIWQEQGLPVVS